MDIRLRMKPTRQMMVKGHYVKVSEKELATPDLILTVLATAECIRQEIYEKFIKNYGLSEGNISLIMTLACNGPLGVKELSTEMGIKPATTSVMIKRMRAREVPLVELVRHKDDARAKVVSLTNTGKAFIKQKLLPELDVEMNKFISVITPRERESLIALLNKLLRVKDKSKK